MKRRTVLVVGCGDLGIRCGQRLVQEGFRITGVRRDISRLPPPFEGIVADYTRPGSLSFLGQLAPDYVIAVFNPTDRSTDGYKGGFVRGMAHLLAGLGDHKPAHIFMTSSTRVYAEVGGGWVDEHSPLTTSDPWAASIIDAEQQLLQSGHSATVIRFAGIYGIPGGRLLSRIRRGELCPAEPVSYTNRIHREDAGAFLSHLVQQAEKGGDVQAIYLGVDDLPAPRFEVESWLAQQMGLDIRSLDVQGVMDPTRHNSAGHKRCRNAALKSSGYELIYPDYRAGYSALLAGE